MKKFVISPKYSVGETVWIVAVSRYLKDPRTAPILECEVGEVYTSTRQKSIDEEDRNLSISYYFEKKGPMVCSCVLPEDQVLPTRGDARNKALDILEESINKLTETIGERKLALCETLREFKILEEETCV